MRCLSFDLAPLLPAIATENRPRLAPSSPRDRLHRSRGRRPGRTADELHALNPSNASLPTIKARLPAPLAASDACRQPDTRPGDGKPDRLPVRCLAFDLAPLLPVIATKNRPTLAPLPTWDNRGTWPASSWPSCSLPAPTRPPGAQELGTKCPRVSQPKRPVSQAPGTDQTQQRQGFQAAFRQVSQVSH